MYYVSRWISWYLSIFSNGASLEFKFSSHRSIVRSRWRLKKTVNANIPSSSSFFNVFHGRAAMHTERHRIETMQGARASTNTKEKSTKERPPCAVPWFIKKYSTWGNLLSQDDSVWSIYSSKPSLCGVSRTSTITDGLEFQLSIVSLYREIVFVRCAETLSYVVSAITLMVWIH